ncbi:MAG: hypothetical protein M0R06_08330 [Sphaerochaeta sp.]|nr:hypothetical protein [Sphaerochaeta sp.]
MLTIKINPNLFKSHNKEGRSVLAASRDANITYPTFRKMVMGIWFPYAMETLSKFLSLLYTPEELSGERFGDIFEVKKEG